MAYARAHYHLALCEMRDENWKAAQDSALESIALFDQEADKNESVISRRKESVAAYRQILESPGIEADEVERKLGEVK